LALFNDKKLLQAVKDKNITIENCPSSNVAIGSTTWDKKHLKRMIDENVRVSVNTDDLSMFNTNMTEEFRRLYKHGIITTWKDFKTLIKNSIEGSFAPAQEKKQLETDFDNELNLIESDPKAKAVIDKYLTSTNNAFQSMFDKLKNLKNSNK
jgi:adenosine deaminase